MIRSIYNIASSGFWRIVFMLLCFLFGSTTTTSTMIVDSPNKPDLTFIGLGENKIRCHADSGLIKSASLLAFKARTGEDNLGIVHLGDSHIQADIFTGEVRKLLSTYFNEPKISRGFCFPYSIAGSNNPENLTCRSSGVWAVNREKTGISGISIETVDSTASISLELKKSEFLEDSFDKINLYFENDSLSFQPVISVQGDAIKTGNNRITYQLANPSNFITIKLRSANQIQNRFLLYGFELLNSQSHLTYHAVGLNGADVKLYRKNNRFGEQLKDLHPNIVIVSIGTNDSFNPAFKVDDFKTSYSALIDTIKKALPGVIIILTTPGDHSLSNQRLNPNIPLVCNQIENVAADKDCLLWDFNSLMGGLGSIKNWANKGLSAPDHLHLSKQGYKLQGELFYQALVDLFETN